jgi:hypothetical protein
MPLFFAVQTGTTPKGSKRQWDRGGGGSAARRGERRRIREGGMSDPGGRGEEGERGMRHVARDGGWVRGWSVKGERRGEGRGGEMRRGRVEMRVGKK